MGPSKSGEQCPSSMKEVRPCNGEVACVHSSELDCAWSEWTSWTTCDAAGQRQRTRGIEKYEQNGGRACTGPIREIMSCAECAASAYTCYWGRWSTWSGCSQTCGSGGVRSRKRSLMLERVVSNTTATHSAAIPAVALSAVEMKPTPKDEKPAARMTQNILSFSVVGCISVLTFFLAMRGVGCGSKNIVQRVQSENARVLHTLHQGNNEY